MRRIVVAALAWTIWLVTAVGAQAERRIALVIGIDRYPALPAYAQLDKAVADARAVRNMLVNRVRFDHVVYGENPTLGQVRDLLHDFSRRLQAGDLAFVFFAGHGANVRLANYLLPSDLPPMRDVSSEAQVRLEEENMIERSISEERIRELVALAGARSAIIVLDACRNNIFREALAAAGPKGRSLANLTSVTGARLVERPPGPGRTQFLSLYSASPGQQALDSLGPADRHPNSPFTRVLVDRLPTPGLRVYEIMRGLRVEVARLAKSVGRDQLPAISDEALDEIVLVGGALAQSGQQAVLPAAPSPGPTPLVLSPVPPVVMPAPRPQATPPSSAQSTPPASVQVRSAGDDWSGWRLAIKSSSSVQTVTAAASPDWRLAAATYRDKTLRFWSLTEGRLIATLRGGGDLASELVFDPRSQLLAGNGGGGIQVWSAIDYKLLFTIPLGVDRVSAVIFSEDGARIVVRAGRGAVRVFEVATQREREATPADAALLAPPSRRQSHVSPMSLSTTGGAVRLARGRRGGEAMHLYALASGDWIGIAEDNLTFTGPAKAVAAFELVKGRDRLVPTEDFVRMFHRPQGLPRP